MSDLISRQAAIDAVRHAWAKGLEPSQFLEVLPSTEPEIIRCRECIHNAHPERTHANCNKFYGMTDQNGFCHEGKRRTDGNA